MKEIIKINSITEVHEVFGLEKPKHPLISVLRVNKALQEVESDSYRIEKFKYDIGLFQISLKDSCAYTISNYGRNSYDF